MRFFADWVVALGEGLVRSGMPPLTVCSVNVPAVPPAALRAPVLCPLSRLIYRDSYEERVNPRGERYFWLGPEQPQDSPEPGSDVALLAEGHITVTMLCPGEGCGVPEGERKAFTNLFPDF